MTSQSFFFFFQFTLTENHINSTWFTQFFTCDLSCISQIFTCIICRLPQPPSLNHVIFFFRMIQLIPHVLMFCLWFYISDLIFFPHVWNVFLFIHMWFFTLHLFSRSFLTCRACGHNDINNLCHMCWRDLGTASVRVMVRG